MLAGGTSRRFGSDKAAALLAGQPMLQWVVSALSEVAEEILVSAAPGQVLPEVHSSVTTRVVRDPVRDLGPLAGMLAAFEAVNHEQCIVVSCDTPLVVPELLGDLGSRLDDEAVAVIPEIEGRMQPLVASYRRSECIETFRECIESGALSVLNAVSKLQNVAIVNETELRMFDPELRSFIGVNTPEEMAALEAFVGRVG